MAQAVVIGGGLAGCEAAWQLACREIPVDLVEMRPRTQTPAHQSGWLAELVCSNSLKSDHPQTASGLLKRELRAMGSLILHAAAGSAVPAGSALAVDRHRFAALVTERLEEHPLIRVVRKEVRRLPLRSPLVLASGPLTSPALSAHLAGHLGQENLYFYDAIAPLIDTDSLDRRKMFTASRYGKGDPAYLNCPMNRTQYELFCRSLLEAETVPLRAFEKELFFQACLPIEELARRGPRTLAFGPFRPVGMIDPRTGKRPYAVVQLRQDNAEASVYNLVGCQTRLRQVAQQRVFRLIPGLERAHILRYGSVHRNTYVCAPRILDATMQVRGGECFFLAGQITGGEGYMEAVGTGLLAGLNLARWLKGHHLVVPPQATALGSLCRYLAGADAGHFQPMNVNFGLLPALQRRIGNRSKRNQQLVQRALKDLFSWMRKEGISSRGDHGRGIEEFSYLSGAGEKLLREHSQGL